MKGLLCREQLWYPEIFSLNGQLVYIVNLEWNLQKPIRDKFLGTVSLRKKKHNCKHYAKEQFNQVAKIGCQSYLPLMQESLLGPEHLCSVKGQRYG